MSARLMGWAPDKGRIDAAVGAIARLGANPDNEIVMRVDGVSRTHARVVSQQDGFYLEDSNSRNGTWLNGERVSAPRRLRHLDVITLGRFADLVFVEKEGAVAPIVEESPLRVQIEWLDGPTRGALVDVALGESLIGRAESCAIVVDSSAASRAHARLTVSGDRVTIEDLGSANGTTVDGQPITTPVTLHSGAEVAIGEARRFRIRLEGGNAAMLATTGPAAPARAAQDMEWATRLVFSAADRQAIAQSTADAMAGRPAAAAPAAPPAAPRPAARPAATPAAPAAPPAAAQASPPPAAPPAAEATIKGTMVGNVHLPTQLGQPPAPAGGETQYAAPSLGKAPDVGAAAGNRTMVGSPGVGTPPKRFEPEPPNKAGEMTVLPGATVLGFREVGPPPRAVGAGGPSSSVAPGPGEATIVPGRARGAAEAPIASVTFSGDQGVFTLTRGASTVGRAPDATMRIDSREVSRIHAVIHVNERDVVIEDRGSVNGSSINGTQFTGNRAIEDGDRVSFADFEFRVAFKRTEGNS
jgi:pSer/pThr/pTyr-binding forkhead associated (FHA) protein